MSPTGPDPGTPEEAVEPGSSDDLRRAPTKGMRLTRLVAYGLGALLVAGIVLLAAAGVPAAVAVIVTVVAVVAMIALGSILGGRNTPQREPVPLHGPDGRRVDLPPAGEPDGPGTPGGAGSPGPGDTMER